MDYILQGKGSKSQALQPSAACLAWQVPHASQQGPCARKPLAVRSSSERKPPVIKRLCTCYFKDIAAPEACHRRLSQQGFRRACLTAAPDQQDADQLQAWSGGRLQQISKICMQVRVLTDHGDMMSKEGKIMLRKDSVHLLPLDEVEHLMRAGIVEYLHVGSTM